MMKNSDKTREQLLKDLEKSKKRIAELEKIIVLPGDEQTSGMTLSGKPSIPDETFVKWQRIVDLMAEVIDVPAGLIMKVDPPQIEVFVTSATKDNPYKKGERADLDTGLYCETVMAGRNLLLVPDALKNPDWDHNPDIELGMISYLGFPVEWPDGKIFGTICVLDIKTNPYSDVYQRLMKEFKEIIEADLRFLVDITERRLIEEKIKYSNKELQTYIDKINAIHKTAQRLQQLVLPEKLAQEIINLLEGTVKYEFLAVLLIDKHSDKMIPFSLSEQGRGYSSIKSDKAFIESKNIKLGVGITGWVAQHGQSVRLGNVRQDSRYYSLRKNIRSELCVPLQVNKKTIGVLNIETQKPNAYTETDQLVLETIASQIAIAIQNSSMHRKTKEYTLELEQNITERKQVEKTLKESEQRFRSYFEMSLIGMAVTSVEKGWIDANDKICEILGYSLDELKQKTWVELTHPDDLDADLEKFNRVLENRIDSYSMEKRFFRKNGSVVFTKISVGCVRNSDGTVNYIVLLMEDITKSKEIEEKLDKHREHLEELVIERTGEVERSQKALVLLLEDVNEINQELENVNIMLDATNKELEAFSFSVSHDLRAPLTRMDGFSNVLLTNYSDKLDDQGIHYLNRIRASSQHMAKLIDDLLSLSRITREKVYRQKVDMSQTAGKIAEGLKAVKPGRKVNFNITEGLSASADRKFVEIVLENILGNAFKFTGKKKNAIIEFGMKTIDDKEVFFIKDNGAGFNMKYYDKIFTAFQRLHSDKEFKGTGIGLAIVQRIINKHGGKIWAESEERKGTTFYFRFE